MARRTFFSFHYDNDVWRANQVRNSNVVSDTDVAGFFDDAEYMEAKQSGDEGIRRMIRKNLNDTTVTVVLIGSQTSMRPWVKYEIAQSIARKNGLLGIFINDLHDSKRPISARGSRPSVPQGVEFPTYDWDRDLDRFRRAIEAAGKRSDSLRAR